MKATPFSDSGELRDSWLVRFAPDEQAYSWLTAGLVAVIPASITRDLGYHRIAVDVNAAGATFVGPTSSAIGTCCNRCSWCKPFSHATNLAQCRLGDLPVLRWVIFVGTEWAAQMS